jgi:hypothetical protein
MNMTVEVGYDEVAGKTLEDLRKDVGPVDVQLKKISIYTG